MTKLSGGQKHLKDLKALIDAGEDLSPTLFVAADIIRTEAVLSIAKGSVSGKGHTPSEPGDPPNRDSGDLDRSISVRKVRKNFYEVVADAPHAVAQEYGAEIENAFGKGLTVTLPERPYMRPASKKHGPKASELIKVTIQRREKG